MNAIVLICVFSMMVATSSVSGMTDTKPPVGTDGTLFASAKVKFVTGCVLAFMVLAQMTSPAGISPEITTRSQPFIIDNNVYFDDRVHMTQSEFLATPQAQKLLCKYDPLNIHELNTTVAANMDIEDVLMSIKNHAQASENPARSLDLRTWCAWAKKKFWGLFSKTKLIWRSVNPARPETLLVYDYCDNPSKHELISGPTLDCHGDQDNHEQARLLEFDRDVAVHAIKVGPQMSDNFDNND